jgi:hypothetical protein
MPPPRSLHNLKIGCVLISNFSERGCVEDQPQQLHIVHDVETREPDVFCNRAAAGPFCPHSRAPAKSGHCLKIQCLDLLDFRRQVLTLFQALAALVR